MNYKRAFTLAEILITLCIIGVVATITTSVLIPNISARINTERQVNIVSKVTSAMDKMKALGLLSSKYTDTDTFVDEFQNHIKIMKRCDAEHIAECWPTSKVINSRGEEVDVTTVKRRRDLLIGAGGENVNNVGLILSDGAFMILTYDTDAEIINFSDYSEPRMIELPVGNNQSRSYVYTTSATDPIDFVMDVNGVKTANSEKIDGKYYDIRSFKIASFAKGCVSGKDVVGIGCVEKLGSSYQCIDDTDFANLNGSSDCWAGAKLTCEEMGLGLPSKTILNKLHTEYSGQYSGSFWASETAYQGNSAWYVNVGSNGYNGITSKATKRAAICVGY